jgi:hypothetical protein
LRSVGREVHSSEYSRAGAPRNCARAWAAQC